MKKKHSEATAPVDIDSGSVEHEIDMVKRTATIKWIGIDDTDWGTDENGKQIDPATAGNCKYVVTWGTGNREVTERNVPWGARYGMEEYTIPKLLAGTMYYCRIVAVNGNDDGCNESFVPAVHDFETPRQRRKTSKPRVV